MARNSNLSQIAGLWINESKDGQTKFMAGTFLGVRIVIFKNKEKASPNSPDYFLNVGLDVPAPAKQGDPEGDGFGPDGDDPF